MTPDSACYQPIDNKHPCPACGAHWGNEIVCKCTADEQRAAWKLFEFHRIEDLQEQAIQAQENRRDAD